MNERDKMSSHGHTPIYSIFCQKTGKCFCPVANILAKGYQPSSTPVVHLGESNLVHAAIMRSISAWSATYHTRCPSTKHCRERKASVSYMYKYETEAACWRRVTYCVL
jgi:hypothetical protein